MTDGPGTAAEERRGLHGLRVVSFESRRATEMAELIRRHGGEPITAPSMREVPLEENVAALEYVRRLAAGDIDTVLLMTGVGLRMLRDIVAPQWPSDQFAAALRRAVLVARGPKPVAALREFGLQPDAIVPEPNTWREILAVLDAGAPLRGTRVAVQEYGASNPELLAALSQRGAEVYRVEIYRWALPHDLEPMRQAIRALCARTVDVALFTSATQVSHVFQVAGPEAEALRAGCAAVLIASIGPVCSEALRAHGLPPDLEPPHGKMGQLVGAVARDGAAALQRKRRRLA